jgi:cytoskeletal protein CcmA (bactofilin family)
LGGERASLAGQQENGRLTVGQEIKLSGEIKSCDRLVVEGTVEAQLSDSRALEVTETGIFRGTAEVDMAEINGVFEGELNVEGRLFIRAQGRVSGNVRYGELEIERGGRIAGEIGNQGEVAASDGYRRPYEADEL